MNYLTNLFNNKQFQNAVSVHHLVLRVKTRDPPAKSTCSNSQDILHETSEGLAELETPQSDELVKLLNKPHVKVGLRQIESIIGVQHVQWRQENLNQRVHHSNGKQDLLSKLISSFVFATGIV